MELYNKQNYYMNEKIFKKYFLMKLQSQSWLVIYAQYNVFSGENTGYSNAGFLLHGQIKTKLKLQQKQH